MSALNSRVVVLEKWPFDVIINLLRRPALLCSMAKPMMMNLYCIRKAWNFQRLNTLKIILGKIGLWNFYEG